MTPNGAGPRWLAGGPPNAPLAVLAHGLEDSWRTWQPLAAVLDRTWRVAALELPWRPGTDYGWRHRPPEDLLTEAIAAVDSPIDLLVAHSYGANAALQLLCRGRLRAVCVALVCPLYRPPGLAVTWQVFERARAAFEQHIRASLCCRLGARLASTPGDVLEAMISKALDRVGPAGFLTVFEQFVASAALPLDQVTTPAMVLAGSADPTLTPAAARALAQRLPNAHLVIDDRYDHFCHVRHPAAVAAQLTGFAAGPRPAEAVP